MKHYISYLGKMTSIIVFYYDYYIIRRYIERTIEEIESVEEFKEEKFEADIVDKVFVDLGRFISSKILFNHK
jgi:hypothetical protein